MMRPMQEMALRPSLLMAGREAGDTGMLYRTLIYRAAVGLRSVFHPGPFHSETHLSGWSHVVGWAGVWEGVELRICHTERRL